MYSIKRATNLNHPLRFQDGSGNSYTTGVTTTTYTTVIQEQIQLLQFLQELQLVH